MKYPLVVENDANAAGFAEIWKSDDLDDAAYLSVSKGVGGTIINKREIVRGHSGFSGEFGHMTIDSNGKKVSMRQTWLFRCILFNIRS